MLSRMANPSFVQDESYVPLKPNVGKPTLTSYLHRFVVTEAPFTAAALNLRERILGPPGGKAYNVGTWALIGGSLAGLASVCLYDWSSTARKDAQEIVLSKDARKKFYSTEAYMLLGMGITAGGAVFGAQSPAVLAMTNWGVIPFSIVSAVAVIGSGALSRSISYNRSYPFKLSTWAIHYAAMGASLAPMCIFAGSGFLRTLIYMGGMITGGSIAGMSACYSVNALQLAKPIGMAMGLVTAVNAASLWLPSGIPSLSGWWAVGAYSALSLHAIYSIYHTKRIVHAAETNQQVVGAGKFDPINAQMSLFMEQSKAHFLKSCFCNLFSRD